METILLDTLGRIYQHGHGMFGACSAGARSVGLPLAIGRT
jgi:hypothetical protein